MSTEVDDIKAMLDVAKERGIRLLAVKVGNHEMRFGEAWPPADPPKPVSHEDSQKHNLRKQSKLHFGRVLDDEQLEQMHKDGLL